MKNALLLILLPMTLILFAASKSCDSDDPVVKKQAAPQTTGNAEPSTQDNKSARDPVALVWQKKFTEIFEKSSHTEAYALFTSGGWSDKGQHLIMFDGKKASYTGVGRNKKSITKEVALSQSDWTEFQRQVRAAQSLQDSNKVSFDGLIFEYIALKKTDGKAKVEQRLFVRNPDHTSIPKHHALFNAFFKYL